MIVQETERANEKKEKQKKKNQKKTRQDNQRKKSIELDSRKVASGRP